MQFISNRLYYGAFFFQPGEYFDCAICLCGIWPGQEVVRLNSFNEKGIERYGNDDKFNTYHAQCLKDQICIKKNQYCVLSETPI